MGDSTAQVRSEIPDVSGFLTSETDLTFTNSQAANITTSDITNLGNLSGTNTGDQNLSSLATKNALGDSSAQLRSEIPSVSGFLNTETDPVFSASEAFNILNAGSGNVIISQERAKLISLPNVYGSETKVRAGANVTVTGKVTTVNPYVIGVIKGTAVGQMRYWNGTAWVPIAAGVNGQILKYKNRVPTWTEDKNMTLNDVSIGDFYQGGIIAYFFEPGDPGYDANVRRGLMAALEDQSIRDSWYSRAYTTIGTTTLALFTGSANTTAIISNQGMVLMPLKFAEIIEWWAYRLVFTQ